MTVKELLYKRRSKLLKEMIATREAKSKFMKDLSGDPAAYAAALRKKAAALLEKNQEMKIIDAKEIVEEIDGEDEQF